MPSIAFGICTSGDVENIRSLLEQILEITKQVQSNYNGYYFSDLIVVSSGASDGTNDILLEYETKIPEGLRYHLTIEETRYGKSDAINKVLALNSADFIILQPADVSITLSSVNHLVNKILDDKQIGLVSGHPIPNFKSSFPDALLYLVLKTIWIIHNQTLAYMSHRCTNTHSSGEFMILRRNIIASIPSEIINDDAYIAMEVVRSGFLIGYEPNAIVSIEIPYTLTDYIVQRKRVLFGHKQLKTLLNSKSSNFRSIFRKEPLTGLKLLLKHGRYPAFLFGLIPAAIIELYIEITMRRDNKLPISPIWRRISQFVNDANKSQDTI